MTILLSVNLLAGWTASDFSFFFFLKWSRVQKLITVYGHYDFEILFLYQADLIDRHKIKFKEPVLIFFKSDG